MGGIDLHEVPLEGVPHQIVEGCRQLTAGRPTADDDDGLQPLAPLQVRGLLGFLQGLEDLAPDGVGILQGLHGNGFTAPFVMAEVAAGGPGREHEMVVLVAAVVEDHLLLIGIDVLHFPHQDLDVFGLAQHHAQGGGDIGLGDQPGGHLIEQRLEEVEVAPVDQGDANGFPRQHVGCP